MSSVPNGTLFRIPPLPLAALAGAAGVAGFAPVGFFPMLIATLALLIVLWRRAASRRHAAVIGFVFGLGYFLAGVSWVYVSLHDFGEMPALLAAALTLVFCCILSCYPALIGYAYFAIGPRSGAATLVVLPALWTLADWVRGWLFTGFPWLALGYSQVPASPLAGYAPVVGVYGITFATALTAGLLVTLCTHPREEIKTEVKSRARLLTFILHPSLFILAGLWMGGYALQQIKWTTPLGTPLSVSLLQGNIPQDMKWREDRVAPTLTTYQELVVASHARLRKPRCRCFCMKCPPITWPHSRHTRAATAVTC